MRIFTHKNSSTPVLTSDNKNLKSWRIDVGYVAKGAMNEIGMKMVMRPIPVRLEVFFYFHRPKSEKKGLRHKTTKPDVDKLSRGLADALTGICFEDDAQIVQLLANKIFDVTSRTEVRLTVLESAA